MIVCSNAKLISLHCPGYNGGRYIGKWNWYKKNTRTSNCWLKVCRLQLVECKAKCRSISNLSETAAAMNFIKDWRSCIKSPKFKECFLKRKTFKSFVCHLLKKSVLKIRDVSKCFALQNQEGKLYPPSVVKRSSFSDALMNLCALQSQL